MSVRPTSMQRYFYLQFLFLGPYAQRPASSLSAAQCFVFCCSLPNAAGEFSQNHDVGESLTSRDAAFTYVTGTGRYKPTT